MCKINENEVKEFLKKSKQERNKEKQKNIDSCDKGLIDLLIRLLVYHPEIIKEYYIKDHMLNIYKHIREHDKSTFTCNTMLLIFKRMGKNNVKLCLKTLWVKGLLKRSKVNNADDNRHMYEYWYDKNLLTKDS